MITNIDELLKKLQIKDAGHYEDTFYVVNLQNSDEYAKMYSNLGKTAVNTENPFFETNSSHNTEAITNYFETEQDEIEYNVFLIADFKNDIYKVKIGEK